MRTPTPPRLVTALLPALGTLLVLAAIFTRQPEFLAAATTLLLAVPIRRTRQDAGGD